MRKAIRKNRKESPTRPNKHLSNPKRKKKIPLAI